MAKLHEETLVIKISKLVRDSETPDKFLIEDTIQSLEAVVQELAGSGALVEIQIVA